MDASTTVLLVGLGKLGLSLARLLSTLDVELWGLNRSGSKSGFPTIQDDISLDKRPGPAKHFDYIVFCVAPSERKESVYHATYITGLKNVLAHYAHEQSRLLLVSSTSVYGQNDGEWVNELAPTHPQGFNGKCLLEAESLVAERSGSVVVRFSGIYGPERQFLLRRFQSQARQVLEFDSYTNRVHQEDAAGILYFLLQKMLRGEQLETVYIGTDCEPVKKSDLFNYFSKLLKLEHMDNLVIESTASVSGKRLDNSRLLKAGYEFIYPSYKEGYRDIVN